MCLGMYLMILSADSSEVKFIFEPSAAQDVERLAKLRNHTT